ncbi:MAG: hypothetical protein Q9212_002880 [Teloschistes hypoglaucus]
MSRRLSTGHGLPITKAEDEDRLAQLGYTQELKREWGLMHNFGASFSIIVCFHPVIDDYRKSLFGYGLNSGGPAVMSIGWLVVCIFTACIGCSMAEILSQIPTSGGPYFWAYMLSPPDKAPFFAWVTGWFNLIGQIAVTSGIDFGLANLISTTAAVINGYHPTGGKTLGILAAILVSQVAVNMFSIKKLKIMIYISVALNTAGIGSMAVAILIKAKTRQSLAFVFHKFFDGTGPDGQGWSVRASPVYVALIGVLMPQYTILGYDASAHLCEETKRAVRDAPLGLVYSVGASGIVGFLVLIALLFAIQDFEAVRQSPQPVLKILTDACGEGGGLVLMVIIMLCIWHCGLFSLTSNSRMMFAFARDGGIPHCLHIIDTRFKCPVRTILFGAVCSFLLVLPVLGSQAALAGTTSIATIGLYISYGIPIGLTLVYPANFKRGPFRLGFLSKPIGVIACLWITFITLILCLPTTTPVTPGTLNYTPVALGITAIFSFASWKFWAKKWFTGRCRNHCRICIRQLDFLGEEMMGRTASSGHGAEQPGGGRRYSRNGIFGTGGRNQPRLTGSQRHILVDREFEVRGYREL